MKDKENHTPLPMEIKKDSKATNIRKGNVDRVKKAWEVIGIVLGILVTAGTVAGVVGRAFYVSRDEYTKKILEDTAMKEQTKATMEELRRTMDQQRASFDKLSGTVDMIRVDISSFRRKRSGE